MNFGKLYFIQYMLKNTYGTDIKINRWLDKKEYTNYIKGLVSYNIYSISQYEDNMNQWWSFKISICFKLQNILLNTQKITMEIRKWVELIYNTYTKYKILWVGVRSALWGTYMFLDTYID